MTRTSVSASWANNRIILLKAVVKQINNYPFCNSPFIFIYAKPDNYLAGARFSCISQVSLVCTSGVWIVRNFPPQIIIWVKPYLFSFSNTPYRAHPDPGSVPMHSRGFGRFHVITVFRSKPAVIAYRNRYLAVSKACKQLL